MPAPTDTPLPPRYADPRPVARGGMAEVVRATDCELGREVAIKVLAARYAQDDGLRKRFEREALAAARLSGNPNIVTIFDVAEHDGRPMIVMEYLSGGSLEERVDGKPPCPPSQVLAWLEDAAAALDAAHSAGIVHRDVKPGNLLLDERSRVHVADFGIASATGMDSFTQTGTILGTAGYLSPEQALGRRAGAASDRYSLAVVAWELLAGRRPFASDSPTAEAAAHAHAQIPSIHSANRSLPRAYDAIFERALAKSPDARYASAAEFVGDLRRGLHDDAGETWVEPAPTRAVSRSAHASRRWWIPAALVVLAVGGVVAAVVSSRGGDSAAHGVQATTIVRTVTGPGRTVEETVSTAAPQTVSAPAPNPVPAQSGGDGVSLDDAGYAKMKAGDYQGALPLLQEAVAKLTGTGSTAEAYADYNLAFTRYALGRCDGVVQLLDSSERIQGHRPEIDKLRTQAQRTCGR